MGGSPSCVSAKSTKKETIQEIYKWFQQLDQQSDDVQIVVPRKQFNQYFSYVKDMLNIDEHVTAKDISAPRVQILDNRSTNAVTMFVQQLQYELSKRNRIDTTVIETFKEALPETVLIAVCNKGQVSSTITAVTQCLHDVERDHYNRIIVVIVYVMRKDSLPKLPSSSEVRGEASFKNIGQVVDMGFDDDTIYSCDTNKKAMDEILQFCRGFHCVAKGGDHANISMNSASNQPKDSMVQACDQKTNPSQDGQLVNAPRNSTDLDVKRYPRITVYLMIPSKTKALSAFIEKFQTKLIEFGTAVKEMEPSEARNLDPSLLLIIICNAASRIESDITKCYDENLRAVRNRTILIAVHVVTKGQEPKMFTELKLANDIFKETPLIKIIDMAFDTNIGMYECTMNDTADNYLRQLHTI
ncbi:uncharacterized protein LOC132730922 [Ruditapes philippinarum]|uniref:uncharacterized protein LOC132730922 n=1 Tax=Ruditapes philippinarum TaxID=129788 RepID=UPI00295BA78F|nr:uncharacterized protein LOC132730922 [Ruditapes philippinarum]